MLFFSPACTAPTVTTAISRGSTSRDTIVWRRMTVAAAMTTGSIVAWTGSRRPPRRRRTVSHGVSPSACLADADHARGERRDVLPEHDVGAGEAVEHAVGDHGERARAVLLGGLEDRHHGARPLVARGDQPLERAQQRGHVHVVAARMHDGHVDAVRVDAGTVLAYGRPVCSGTGRLSMSAQPHDGSVAVAHDSDDARATDALVRLDAELRECRDHDARGAGLLE